MTSRSRVAGSGSSSRRTGLLKERSGLVRRHPLTSSPDTLLCCAQLRQPPALSRALDCTEWGATLWGTGPRENCAPPGCHHPAPATDAD